MVFREFKTGLKEALLSGVNILTESLIHRLKKQLMPHLNTY